MIFQLLGISEQLLRTEINIEGKRVKMRSHKLLPKCVLTNYKGKKNLVCYDVVNCNYSYRSAKDFNVENDYYSEEIEEYLSGNVEQQLGSLISTLKSSFDSLNISRENIYEGVIKNYVRALYARSSKLINDVAKGFVLKDFYPKQFVNNFTVCNAMDVMEQEGFLNDFKVTFLFNHTNDEIILPSDGFTYHEVGESATYVVPVSPNFAFLLYRGTDIYDGKVALANEESLMRLNGHTIKQQRYRNRGYVLASQKVQLERALEYEKQWN